jgi:hypothetical protein
LETFVRTWPIAKTEEMPRPFLTRMTKWSLLMDKQGKGGAMNEGTDVALEAAEMCEDEEDDGTGVNRPRVLRPQDGAEEELKKKISKSHPSLNAKMLYTAACDSTAQGLGVKEISALSGALEMGHVLETHEIEGENYGGDPRAYAVVKAATKYDDSTYSKLLAAGKLRELSSLVTDLARDYASAGHAQQAVLISSWWTETQVGFKGDDKAMLFYLKAYRRSYAGRGFPVNWDERMAVRSRNEARTHEGPTLSREDIAKIVRTETASLTQDNVTLSREVKRLSNRPAEKAKPRENDSIEPKESRLKKTKCYKCGKKGHLARDCPEADADDDAEGE